MSTRQSNNRTGIVLAAGFGSRLNGSVKETNLKPLTPVAGVPLIFRVIESLNIAGCNRVVIVLGHGYEEIKQRIQQQYDGPIELIYAYNDKYDLQNGVSVLSAADYVEDEFVLTMADHILEESLMQKARKHVPPTDGATLLVDYKIDTIFDMDDATKVLAEEEKLKSIGKQIQDYNCIDTGVFLGTQGLLNALKDRYQETGDVSLSDGVQELARRGKMEVLDIGNSFWQDVDTPEMMAYAEEQLAKDSISV
ncbi:NTP transferase domain-containing protein [Fodinibius halophilus]|uniref:NTP transferase domain-containing protein n=1 Tax=Fodinibius halophilus TaxID=1736908 RepID=A0A6M1SZ14_9BACT|nr:NTP transferase domain-containing protein [Fodinibius halophilus]NGP86879.1 NTP transferase domain-containing protein [Fodinibius halophilus]